MNAYVTTSWDDGHPLDLRLAEVLAAAGVAGTFYVPLSYPPMPRLSAEELRKLSAMGFEIGSHTMTHALLSDVPEADARRELVDSKHALEDIIGAQVSALCYPCGKFNRRAMRLVREAGYTLGRTTVPYRTSLAFDPMAMPVSYQLKRHGKFIHARHAIRTCDFAGLTEWMFRHGCASEPVALAASCFARARATSGVYHLWGHSWEVEQFRLWPALEAILALVAKQPDVRYVTNTQLARAIPS
jgi:hypothetical protein